MSPVPDDQEIVWRALRAAHAKVVKLHAGRILFRHHAPFAEVGQGERGELNRSVFLINDFGPEIGGPQPETDHEHSATEQCAPDACRIRWLRTREAIKHASRAGCISDGANGRLIHVLAACQPLWNSAISCASLPAAAEMHARAFHAGPATEP